MANYIEIKAEYWSDRTKNKDKPIALTFKEGGRNSFSDVKWLSVNECKKLKESLQKILDDIKL